MLINGLTLTSMRKMCGNLTSVRMFSPISERVQIERRLQIESALYLYPGANVENDRPPTSSDL